jgi:hypothetical protein
VALNNVVSTATRYGLDPIGCKIFRTHPHMLWGPPSLLYNGYCVSFLGLKRPGRGVNRPPRLALRLKKSVGIHLLPPYAFMAGFRVNISSTFYHHCLLLVVLLRQSQEFRFHNL